MKEFERFDDTSKEESKNRGSEDIPGPVESFEFDRVNLLSLSQKDLKSYIFSFMMINWVFFFVLFGSSVLTGIVIGVLEIKDFHRVFDVAKTMRDIVNSDPIHSIVSLDKDATTCPAGYELLDLGEWAGTKPGCYNPDNDRLFPAQTCDVDVYYPVPETKPAPLYDWKGHKFCVARIKETDRIPLNYCTNDHKKCQNFCVVQDLNCPFHAVTSSNEIQIGMTKGGHEERLRVNDTWLNFHAVSEPGNATDALTYPQQFIGFRFGTGGTWCIDGQRSSEVDRFFSGRKHIGYPLSNRREIGCGWFGGINGSLNTHNQKKFYEDNQIGVDIKDLPLYDKFITNETVDLIPIYKGYSVFQLAQTEECKVVGTIDHAHVESLKNIVDALTSKIVLGEWLSYSICGISAIMILLGSFFAKNTEIMRTPELTFARITAKVLIGLIIICLIFDILTLIQWANLNKVESWIQTFLRCSVVLKDNKGSPLNVFWGQVGFVVAFVNLTFVITVLFYIYVRKKIKKETTLAKRTFSSYSDIAV